MHIDFARKSHIFENNLSTLCGLWEGYVGRVGRYSTFVSEKQIKEQLALNGICKSCVRILRKRRKVR